MAEGASAGKLRRGIRKERFDAKMIIRNYQDADYSSIAGWVADKRIHALWCANRMPVPMSKADFDNFMQYESETYGLERLVAVDDAGKAVGFAAFSFAPDDRTAMIKFVIVDPSVRCKGYGKEMMRLVVKHILDVCNAKAISLCVFDVNAAARRCYESVGFRVESVDEAAFEYDGEVWGRCHMVLLVV